jgi:hypothetical protein
VCTAAAQIWLIVGCETLIFLLLWIILGGILFNLFLFHYFIIIIIIIIFFEIENSFINQCDRWEWREWSEWRKKELPKKWFYFFLNTIKTNNGIIVIDHNNNIWKYKRSEY